MRLEEVARHFGGPFGEPSQQNGRGDRYQLGAAVSGARSEGPACGSPVGASAREDRTNAALPANIGPPWFAVASLGERVLGRSWAGEHTGERTADGDGARELVEHRLNGRDPRDGLGPELPSVGVGADHASVDVDRATAHARDHLGDLESGVRRFDEHQILMRPKLAARCRALRRRTVRARCRERRSGRSPSFQL